MSTDLVRVEQTALATAPMAGALERVLIGGDLSGLNSNERIHYYKAVCESVGLNPLTKPFDYLDLDGKLTLYAKRDCTDQLRSIHGVSIKIVSRELVEGVYVVTAQAAKPDGRCDEAIGAVPLVKEGGEWKQSQNGKRYFQGNGQLAPLPPDARANAIMKAETKSKRRVTLSICGLGMIDESELDSVQGARPLNFDPQDARQAQQEVAERTIAELKADPKPLPPPQPPPPPPPAEEVAPHILAYWKRLASTDKYEKLKVFQELKQMFVKVAINKEQAEGHYRACLAKHGCEKSDQFKKLGDAKACVVTMCDAIDELVAAVNSPDGLGISDADLPANIGSGEQGSLIDMEPVGASYGVD